MPGNDATQRRVGLIDQVAARMREMIVSAQWPVGTRIPTEPELSQQAGVGRNTVREAVQSLVHAGLLERRQGSGTYVIATSELPMAMTRQFAHARQRDVLEVRQALEIVAAALAAGRRTPEQVVRLRELLEERAQAVVAKDLDQMVRTDMSLHRYIAEVSGNPVLFQLYATVLDAVAENIRFNFGQHITDGPGHNELVDAIADGDPGQAAHGIEMYLQAMIDALPGPTEA